MVKDLRRDPMDQALAAWRKQQRANLLAMRQQIGMGALKAATAVIARRLDALLPMPGVSVLGLYWPIKREPNLLSWARDLVDRTQVTLCLPVVVTRQAPLAYWRWTPDDPMTTGFWDIPIPARQDVVQPDMVLAPLVGFDGARYRLGYGGGYFDRTLGALTRRPLAIGIGYEFSVLETIDPQPHDIPMDAVLTEKRALLPTQWRTPGT